MWPLEWSQVCCHAPPTLRWRIPVAVVSVAPQDNQFQHRSHTTIAKIRSTATLRPDEQAEPLEGGQLVAGGRMWISPEAETDTRAVRMQLQGRGLPAEALLQRYLPPVRWLQRLHWFIPLARQLGTTKETRTDAVSCHVEAPPRSAACNARVF